MSGPYSLLVILVTFAFAEPAEKIITPPTNVTQKSGETAQFKCQVDLELEHNMQWSFSDRIIYTYQGGEEGYPSTNTRKYLVKQNGNNFTLVIDNLRYKDGGKYTCGVLMEYEDAVLIVLEQPSLEPPMSIPIEGDTANYTCKACFGGPKKDEIAKDHYPQLIMYMDSSTSEQLLNQTEFPGKDNYCLVKVLQLTVDATMHGKQMSCEIATNKPAMKFLKSTEVNVMYSVRNITYIPNKEKYDIGNIITCIADGNPPPIIEWKKLEGEPISSTWLNITEDMLGKHLWSCSGKNEIREKMYKLNITVSINAVLVKPDSEKNLESSSGFPTAAVVVPVFFIVILALIGIFMAWIYKNNEPILLLVHNKSSKCRNMIENIQNKEDLDEKGENILKMLKKDGKHILKDDKSVFSEMIKKSNRLIESTYYEQIIQTMALICEEMLIKPEKEPLHHLFEVIGGQSNEECLFRKNPDRTLSLIKTLIPGDEGDPSKYLMDLIKLSEYIRPNYIFKWTTKFIATLEHLLQKGAEPTWIENGSENLKGEKIYTAQYHFFFVISRILLSKNDCFDSMKETIRHFMTDKSAIASEHPGTPLHALVELDWKLLEHHEQRPVFFERYKKVITLVIETFEEHNTDFLDSRDWCGRTALHLFVEKIELHEDSLADVIEIANVLKSEDYLSNVKGKGYNVLHFLADAYPLFRGEISKKGQDTLLEFTKDLKSDSEVDVQDSYGKTPLHILTNKVKEITPHHNAFLLELVKVFKTESNIDLQDNKGRTVLHLLAYRFPQYVPEENLQVFCELMEYFCTETYATDPIKDHHQKTALHILVEKFNSNTPPQHQNIFNRLVEALKPASNIPNKQRQTALHILGKQVFLQPDLKVEVLPIFTTLTTQQNVNAEDKESVTPYSWILKGKLANNGSTAERIFLQIEKILRRNGANERLAIWGFPFIEKLDENKEQKLKRLEEHISVEKRKEYMRAYEKDIRQYLMLDEELLDELEEKNVITSEQRKDIEGNGYKSEDQQVQHLLNVIIPIIDNKKYLDFLEILAEEYEPLVSYLTGGHWIK